MGSRPVVEGVGDDECPLPVRGDRHGHGGHVRPGPVGEHLVAHIRDPARRRGPAGLRGDHSGAQVKGLPVSLDAARGSAFRPCHRCPVTSDKLLLRFAYGAERVVERAAAIAHVERRPGGQGRLAGPSSVAAGVEADDMELGTHGGLGEAVAGRWHARGQTAVTGEGGVVVGQQVVGTQHPLVGGCGHPAGRGAHSGRSSLRAGVHYFSPPAVRPSTIRRWKNNTATTSGRVTTTPAAICVPNGWSYLYWPVKSDTITFAVIM